MSRQERTVILWVLVLSLAFLVAFGVSVRWWVDFNDSSLGAEWSLSEAIRFYPLLLGDESENAGLVLPRLAPLVTLWALSFAVFSLAGAVVTWRWLTPRTNASPEGDLDYLLAVELHLKDAEESRDEAKRLMVERIRAARARAHDTFHLLWSRVGSGAPYDKQAWIELQGELEKLWVGRSQRRPSTADSG